MPERVGDQATMEPPKFERCSILLTFQKLMISVSNRTTELWTKQPRRDGGRASGPSEEAPRGGPATFRLRADHTELAAVCAPRANHDAIISIDPARSC